MVVSKPWYQAYVELSEFIASHPEVEIEASVVSLPSSVRSEFYYLFDTVRTTFLKEKYPNFLYEASLLTSNYARAAQEVTKSLGLLGITIPAHLNWFMSDPVDGLIRSLFDPLFDLLKGKIGINVFECEASRNIEKSLRQLYGSGYEKWVTLSLVNLLAPDKAFVVPIEDVQANPDIYETEKVPGLTEEKVPTPEEVKFLSMKEATTHGAVFIVPNILVHSNKAKRYVAIRTQLTRALSHAKVVSQKREWYRLSSVRNKYGSVVTWPSMLVNIGDTLEDIALIADAGRICRPDLIIECREQKEWYEKEGLTNVKRHHAALKPKLGTFIISREPVPEQAYQEITQEQESEKQGESIHILTVGLDQSKLDPIFDMLMNHEDKIFQRNSEVDPVS